MNDTTIRILAKPQVNPLKCEFEVDRPVLDGTAWFGDAEAAKESPMAEAIFALGGVAQVLIRGRTLLVTRDESAEWTDLARQVGSSIREHLQSGAPIVHPDAVARPGATDDQHLRSEIQRVLDGEINPAIASHGGIITLLDVQDGNVYIKMGGGCQGCASSTATLKHGVEQTLRARFPEVVEILDTTDHAAGTNPYYSPLG